MSGQPDFGGFEPVPPNEFFARLEAQQATVRMAGEDFTNRWQELMLDLDDEHLVTLCEAFASIGNADAEGALRMGNFFEGQLRSAAFFRGHIAAVAPDPNRHGFVPDAEDLDNPCCAAQDKNGTVCGLPPANGRHQ